MASVTQAPYDKMTKMDENLQDLTDDFNELLTLLKSSAKILSSYHAKILNHQDHLSYGAFTQICALVDGLDLQFRINIDAIRMQLENRCSQWQTKDIPRLIALKKQYSDTLRIVQSQLGMILTADQWQSPSAQYATLSQAGTETGHITATINDYKRDIHQAAEIYEAEFGNQYIDQGFRPKPHTYVTSSGMSAYATVLQYLQIRYPKISSVLAGKGSYFQNIWLTQGIFKDAVIFCDEFNSEEIVRLAHEQRPQIILLDTLCNNQSMAMPDLSYLIPRLAQVLPKGATIVLDNTGMATYCQPFKDLPHLSFNIKLIVIESLLKYHQYGLDRVNGGIIYAYDFSSPSLLQTRRNVGTILPDVSVSSLPRPNRNIFDKRMLRIGRNNKNFAQYLDNWIKNNASPIEYIVHPSLPTYQAFERTRKLPFQGGSFVIAFKKSLQSDSFHLRFIKSILAAAKNMNVPIVEGTSFGFDTTRIYLTARFSDGPTASFIRISAGTETQVELTALMGVFTQVLEKAGI